LTLKRNGDYLNKNNFLKHKKALRTNPQSLFVHVIYNKFTKFYLIKPTR